MPAVLPTGLPSCRPAFRRACRPAFLPTSLPACLPASCLDARCFILSRSYLPSCRTTSSILFSLSVCRHADGCGHALSHFLDLPACLPAGLPFSTLDISFSLPTCRHADGCGHAFSYLLDLPACLPDRLFNIRYLFFFADMPSCRWPRPFLLSSLGPACLPAGRIALDLSVSLAKCRHADGRGHALSHLLNLPACCLPDRLFRHQISLFPLPTCRHADGRGHFFSHLLELPACLPAGSPFSTPLFSFPEFHALLSCALPACRMLDCFR